jgi:transcriptional regulator with PAS, ATPase and Fis domain
MVIASSSTPLFNLLQSGQFNTALFSILNKAPIEVPPLRKRPYDIPLLINHYLWHYNNLYKKSVVLSTQSIRLLRNHKWPGNICELKQAIEKIVIHSCKTENVVGPDLLASVLGEKSVQFIEEQSISYFYSLKDATEEFKRNFLLYLLRKNKYDLGQVSGRLNLSSQQLKNQLLELNIDF